VDNIRALGFGQHVVLAPNGVDCPELAARPSRSRMEERWPVLRGQRWVVFLSRLHPKKGLDVLLQAWAQARRPDNAVLVIAGSDLIGYRRVVERFIREFNLEQSVCLPGEVRGEDKDALLANAELLVLPSHSENFGMVIAEAMSWARPVIASTATPWSEVVTRGAGWWVAPERDAFSAAIEAALAMPREHLDAMGRAGRALVETSYTWSAAARLVVDSYGTAVGHGTGWTKTGAT
jgi:glycosyltransferase involved in cell wall biosynthesis